MLLEYCVISVVNALLISVGAAIVIASKHSLAQWRLNKPATVPLAQQQVKP
jgi:hypothetical protein